MRQKKLLSVLLAGVMVTFGMTLVACGPDTDDEIGMEDEAVEESWEDTGEMVEEETDELEEYGDEYEDDAEEYGDELEDEMEDDELPPVE